ncbi:YdbH family protein [Xenorhabdus budapestensis]|uniref:YdbH family protein n=2 Tax=Xenorhabdus budapestensis TaxID=290110 RepID=A0ABX7VFG4_XENBU|nr:YdbH family protein [Xenorhabdus budapestensis]QTL38362.1 YdbH family protein [Xenorhabdus budapestensis]
MTRILRVFTVMIILLVLSVLIGWFTLPRWLPLIASHWLPQGMTLSLTQPKWEKNILLLDHLSLQIQECELFKVSGLSAGYSRNAQGAERYWDIHIAEVYSQSQCLSQLPATNTQSAPLSISVNEILSSIPAIKLSIDHFVPAPWQEFAGKLKFDSSLQGHRIEGQLSVSQYPEPLLIALEWQGQNGKFTVTQLSTHTQPKAQFNVHENNVHEKNEPQIWAELPWSFNQSQFVIRNGKWRWTSAAQPLSGGVDLTLEQWKKGLNGMQASGRVNLLTQNEFGKGNVVLSIKPTPVSLTNAHIPFQLTGQMNRGQMIMAMSLPAIITGSLAAPKITFQPGSLFRGRGKVSENFTVKEARLPLAGTYLTRNGFTGRLQAIVTAKESYWGTFRLHFDGYAEDFIPDHGNWNWRYWGNGDLPPLKAKWDISGKGSWKQSQIMVNALNTGFDTIDYGLVQMKAPRLQLMKPLVWKRSVTEPALTGDLKLSALRTDFRSGGFLPPVEFRATLTGQSPNNFMLNGKLYGKGIGPIPVYGRWDGTRLRGEARWPRQSLLAFQTLIPADLGITVRGGNIYAQAAFSAARGQGLRAGGHWVVKNAGMWLKNGNVDGVDFVLPWRLQEYTWQLGVTSPVQLRIKTVNGLFNMDNVSADLQGFYPPTEIQPLILSNVNIDMLDGKLRLNKLQLPQKQAAVLHFNKLSVSKLFDVLKVKQLAMSGKISGELPVLLNDKQWIVQQGWIANDGDLTLRLDKDTVDSIGKNDLTAGLAMDWLRYLEISRSKAYVTLDNLGILVLQSEINGVNPVVDKKREVRFNYRHEENIFQLWRSLRFGSNLEEWLEKNISVGS